MTQQSPASPPAPSGLLSVEEVAAAIGRHPEVVRRQARAKRLPAEKIGRVWFFRPESLHKAGYTQFRSSASVNPATPDPLLVALSKAGLEALQLLDRDRIFHVVGERLAEVGLASYFFLVRDDFAGLVIAHEHVGGSAPAVKRLSGNPEGPVFLPFEKIPVLHRACRTREPQYIGDPEELVRSIARTIGEDRSTNAETRSTNARKIADTLDLRTAVSAPFVTQDRVVGAITVVGPALKETDLPAIKAFANQTAAAIETARLLAQAHRTQEAFVQTLAGAIELREQLHGRSAQRAEVSDRLAEHLGLDSSQRRRVRYAALLQDLGKLGLPDSILNKETRLNSEERAIMMTHPAVGAELLSRFDSLADLAPLVRAHHECFNGDGYPDGLSGNAIPVEMRIVAVVNAFFNVTLDLTAPIEATLADGLSELRRFAGIGIDPSVVETFIAMCETGARIRAPWYERLEQASKPWQTMAGTGRPRDILGVADSRELRIIYRVAQESSAVLDMDVLLQRIVDILREVMGYYMVAVILPVEGVPGLIVGAQSGYPITVTGRSFPPGEGITGWVYQHGTPLIVPDVREDARYIGVDPNVRSELAFPLISRGRIIGVLNAESEYVNAFSAADLALMSAVGSQLAASVEVAQLHDTLKREATHDPLTRLNNRRLFLSRIQQEIARAESAQEAFSVVFLDVNDLKLVNDTYGHLAGDALLREVATALTDAVRGEDVVARYGGDEFVVLLPATPRAAATVVAQRIADGIARHRFMAGQELLKLPGVSLGLATFPDDGQTPDELLAVADVTLYEQKRRSA
ncbi:MAG: diguanylate cyclase [Candidatus Dormibacteraeota bacterium]|nr:diguanylate cyclase [Candidatus Dormibacteraeota bacterium]